MRVRAIIVHPPKPGVEFTNLELETTKLKPNEVLVKTFFTGICGTDREVVNGLIKHATPPSGRDYMILGHEVIGEVVEVGDQVHNLKRGDKVVALVRRGCGKCISCKLGRPDLCETGEMQIAGVKGHDGFMVDYFIDDSTYLVRVPDSIANEEAVLIQPLGDIVKAVNTGLGIANFVFPYYCEDFTYSCKKAGIIGSGSTGILFAAYLRLLGFDVTLLNRRDPTELEAKISEGMGAQFKNFNKEEVKELDLLVDTSGSISSLYRLAKKVKPKGLIILFGFGIGDETNVNSQILTDIVYKNIIIVGSVAHGKAHLQEAVRVFTNMKNEFPTVIKNMITKVIGPEDSIEYIKSKQKNEIKTVIKWS